MLSVQYIRYLASSFMKLLFFLLALSCCPLATCELAMFFFTQIHPSCFAGHMEAHVCLYPEYFHSSRSLLSVVMIMLGNFISSRCPSTF